MKLNLIGGFILLAILFACNPDIENTNNESLKLWYDEPAEEWTAALPLGNGRLGAMVFGGVEQDRIQFNEETLWTGEPRDYSRDSAYLYLDEIRKLLFEGKQSEAEKLAEAKFMGRKSNEKEYGRNKEEWLKKVRSSNNIEFSQPEYDDSQWKEMQLPTDDGWEKEGLNDLDGVVWYKTTFDLPESWANKNLVLDVSRVRDLDFTYVNGKQVGTTENNQPRSYTVPAGLIKKGKNVIAIQVINFDNKGGIVDSKMPMAIYPKGADEKDKVSLSNSWKYHIQDNNPPAFPQYMAAYQPFGDLWLNFQKDGEVEDYKRELDIVNAISKTSYKIGDIEYTREYFISTPDQVIAVHLTASQPGNINLQAVLNSPHVISSSNVVEDNMISMNLQVRNGALKGFSHLKAVTENGEVSASENGISIKNADQATLYLTAGTNFKSYNDISADPEAVSLKAIKGIENISYDQIKQDHINEYQKWYEDFAIVLGQGDSSHLTTDIRIKQFSKSNDHALMALYVQYGRYLLISSSRPGTNPANLQGIWNDLLNPPWGSKYTTNINAEMNYWPAELLNLSEMHQPLFKLIEEVAERGKETAREHYRADGWVLHHNTDLWRGTAPVNASNHGIWVTGGAWLSHHLWEHYLFTMDEAFLKDKAYPVMKGSAQFFLDFLVMDPKTGWLISSPSNSPETGGLVAGPSIDHQIIRSLFKKSIEATHILNIDQEFRSELKDKLEKIAPDQIGQFGQLQEWVRDIDDPENKHRHVSHLWAVYPGNEITQDTPELMDAAKQSLLFRGDEGTGWSLAWKINWWARFKDGDHAYKMVQNLLSPADDPNRRERGGSYKNLFDAHPPFQIDGNFGGAAGIVEMLIQSHNDIHLLPALPSQLSQGAIRGVCARGGFVLDFDWLEGKLQNVKVYSKAGEKCIIKYGDKEVSFETEEGQSYSLNGELQLL